MDNLFNKAFFRQILIFLVIILTGFSLAAVLVPYMSDNNEVSAVTSEN